MNTTNDYLFNFKKFVKALRADEEKKDIVEKFEKAYGSLEGKDYTDMPFYTEYLAHFEISDEFMDCFKVPDNLANFFDYKLLFQLVAASFSSEYMLMNIDETNQERLRISVVSGNQSVVKDLDELWSFQILRLFEIYFEEQISMANLMSDSQEDSAAIACERTARLMTFAKCLARQNKDRAQTIHRQKNQADLDLINKTALHY